MATKVGFFLNNYSDAHFQPTHTCFQGGLSPEALKLRAAARAAAFQPTTSVARGSTEPADGVSLFARFVLN